MNKAKAAINKIKIRLDSTLNGFPQDTFRSLTGRGGIEKYQLLHKIAKKSNGPIVEIGSYLGLSAFALSDGSQRGNQWMVYCIDPQKELTTKIGRHYGNNKQTFRENVSKSRGKNLIFEIHKTSEQAAKDWNKEIGTLFIDGDHSYQECKKDYQRWQKWVKRKGTLIIDDIGNYQGPTQLLKEIRENEQQWSYITQVNTTATLEKVAE